MHQTLVDQCPNPEGPHATEDSIRDILREENGLLTDELTSIVREAVEAGSKPPSARPTRSIGVQTEVHNLQTLVSCVGAVQIVPIEPKPQPEVHNLQTVASFVGVVQMVPTEPKPQPEPLLPDWLTKALTDLQALYRYDSFRGLMKYYPIDPTTNNRIHLEDGQPPPADTKYMFIPRIKCKDCPGKLYVTGAGMTVSNFEIHLKNNKHREKVNARHGMETNPLHLMVGLKRRPQV